MMLSQFGGRIVERGSEMVSQGMEEEKKKKKDRSRDSGMEGKPGEK